MSKDIESYKISADDTNEYTGVAVVVNVDDEIVTTININAVKISNTWYVDNFNSHADKLYHLTKQ